VSPDVYTWAHRSVDAPQDQLASTALEDCLPRSCSMVFHTDRCTVELTVRSGPVAGGRAGDILYIAGVTIGAD
jgi:hypothetical protein